MPGLNSIDGLNSGLNTTQIIDAIMTAERQPAALLEQKQADTTNIITSYKALQAKFLALNTELVGLSKESTFDAATTSVSDETYATAEALGTIAAGSYDVQVLSLARNHQIASQGVADSSQALFGTGTISIQVGNGSVNTLTIDSSNNSLVGIRKAINDANIGVRASIINDGSDSNAYSLVLSANDPGL
jgi:flagellar hook-associated protein 2